MHVNDAGEIQAGNVDILHISVKQLQKEIGHLGLFRILHANTELIGVIGRQIECHAVIITHGLDELEEVDHVHTEHMLDGAVEILKTICMEPQIDQHRMSLIYSDDFHSLGVKL